MLDYTDCLTSAQHLEKRPHQYINCLRTAPAVSTWVLHGLGFTAVRKQSFFTASAQHRSTFVHLSELFLHSFPNMLCCEVLVKITAKPGWMPSGWKSLDFSGPTHTATIFPASRRTTAIFFFDTGGFVLFV